MGGGGGSLFSGLGSIFSAIGPILSIGIEILKVVVSALENLAKSLGIIEEDEDVEDLGDRALQSEKQPDDFEEFDDYLNHIRSIEINPEKSANFSEGEKLAAGAIVLEKGIEVKTGQQMEDFLQDVVTKNPEYYNAEKIQDYIDVFSEEGVDLNKISDLENDKIANLDEKDKVYSLIEKADLA